MKRFALIAASYFLACFSVNASDFTDTKVFADQGEAWAQYNVALMYFEGKVAPQDYAEAVKWYCKAAEQGYGGAQTNLGSMYCKQLINHTLYS